MLTLNSDIVMKVVQYIERVRSARSGENPPEAVMFAKPVNVLSSMGDILSPVTVLSSVTVEDTDQIATIKDFAREDVQLNDTIKRMPDFLSDNTTFEWLKQRVQALMSNMATRRRMTRTSSAPSTGTL
jgi:hypothetical protein